MHQFMKTLLAVQYLSNFQIVTRQYTSIGIVDRCPGVHQNAAPARHIFKSRNHPAIRLCPHAVFKLGTNRIKIYLISSLWNSRYTMMITVTRRLQYIAKPYTIKAQNPNGVSCFLPPAHQHQYLFTFLLHRYQLVYPRISKQSILLLYSVLQYVPLFMSILRL